MYGWSRHQAPDEVQILTHIGFNRVRRRIRLQIGKAAEANVFDGVDHRRKIDFTFAQVVRIIFQMELANTALSQPADLFYDIEAAIC